MDTTAAVQLEYNPAQRAGERELLTMTERLGIGVVCWGPLAGGRSPASILAAETNAGSRVPPQAAMPYRDERTAHSARAVVDAAAEIGCSPAQLAIAWLIHQSPRFVPLIGARTPNQLAETLDAAHLTAMPLRGRVTRGRRPTSTRQVTPCELLRTRRCAGSARRLYWLNGDPAEPDRSLQQRLHARSGARHVCARRGRGVRDPAEGRRRGRMIVPAARIEEVLTVDWTADRQRPLETMDGAAWC